jgi:hypothetical protein
VIYAVQILDQKFVKIGFSSNEDVGERIAALQTGCPFEIRPMFTTFGTLRQEKAIHSSLTIAFGRIRVPMPPNEWYPGKTPLFAQFLEHLRYGADAALMLMEKYNPSVNQGGCGVREKGVVPNIRWPAINKRGEVAY